MNDTRTARTTYLKHIPKLFLNCMTYGHHNRTLLQQMKLR